MSFLLLRIRNSEKLDISFCFTEEELKAGKLFVSLGNIGIKFEFALCANKLCCYDIPPPVNNCRIERRMIVPKENYLSFSLLLPLLFLSYSCLSGTGKDP